MTDHEVRIAIAEACGWRFHPDGCGFIQPGGNDWIGRGYKTLSECCPDYPNDLNAMASAETYAQKDLMNADQWENYGRLLYKAHPTAVITDSNGVLDFYAIAELMTGVTARQRAEAFLRTIGKWKEEVTA